MDRNYKLGELTGKAGPTEIFAGRAKAMVASPGPDAPPTRPPPVAVMTMNWRPATS